MDYAKANTGEDIAMFVAMNFLALPSQDILESGSENWASRYAVMSRPQCVVL
ncbi:hypothetical protein [Bradyrhizobium sp. BR 1433]|uniref:hypothetical protein n=1 Tax=Bradyrhizobium sp. BR 1433 TaxID=3447967 RepID=UPI003EE77F69